MSRLKLSIFMLTSFAMLILLLPAQTTFAADITVNKTCSLADAITAANKNAATGGCAAGDEKGKDQIILTASVTLDAPLPEITSNITIKGRGFTVSGAKKHPIFRSRSHAKLQVHNLTLRNGRPFGNGGAISGGTITVRNCVFTNNLAAQGGGAIYTYRGTVDVRNSKFKNNGAATDGGAIYSYEGTVKVHNSTFTRNSSDVDGGEAHGHGGAIYNYAGTVKVHNSTFNNNNKAAKARKHGGSEGGAIFINEGTVEVRGSAFKNNHAFNGGAIYTYRGAVDVRNSTFTGNTADERGTVIYSYEGSITVSSSKLGDAQEVAIYNHTGPVSFN